MIIGFTHFIVDCWLVIIHNNNWFHSTPLNQELVSPRLLVALIFAKVRCLAMMSHGQSSMVEIHCNGTSATKKHMQIVYRFFTVEITRGKSKEVVFGDKDGQGTSRRGLNWELIWLAQGDTIPRNKSSMATRKHIPSMCHRQTMNSWIKRLRRIQRFAVSSSFKQFQSGKQTKNDGQSQFSIGKSVNQHTSTISTGPWLQ